LTGGQAGAFVFVRDYALRRSLSFCRAISAIAVANILRFSLNSFGLTTAKPAYTAVNSHR
jgi:hypothetical protein